MNHIIVVQCKKNLTGWCKEKIIKSNPGAQPTAPILAVCLVLDKGLKHAKKNQFKKFKRKGFLYEAGKQTISDEPFEKRLDALRHAKQKANDLRCEGLRVYLQENKKLRRVYVIYLRDDVLEDDKFFSDNPDRKEGEACLYVGQTSNTLEKRMYQHKTKGWPGSPLVYSYGKDYAYEFFEEDRTFSPELEALEEEERLGLELRERGYATTWG